ncbi:MAG: hypothetical protein L0H53_13090 [Candidatus Nitrosocosmicus sp.]|nr:hypothetical protein [Candidatus Nitrosocosmicus sp.]MDN5868460.1 hypothetical protein [Candidatus Nitrosocosmicus sp.]
MNNLGIDVVEKESVEQLLRMIKERYWMNSFFGNDVNGISNLLSRVRTSEIRSTTTTVATQAVLESTGNMWMRIHDTLEENGIDTVLANPYKTRIIAEAKIKSD